MPLIKLPGKTKGAIFLLNPNLVVHPVWRQPSLLKNHITVVPYTNHIPTTTVILIWYVVGIPVFMIKQSEYQPQLHHHKTDNFGGKILVLIINTEMWTTHHISCCWYVVHWREHGFNHYINHAAKFKTWLNSVQ